MRSAPAAAKVTLDLTGLDNAVTALGRAVDELHVLGPSSLYGPVGDYFDRGTEFRDMAIRGAATQVDLERAAALFGVARTSLMTSAAAAGLAELDPRVPEELNDDGSSASPQSVLRTPGSTQ